MKARARSHAKALAAAAVGLAAVVFAVATGEQVDPAVLAAVQSVLGTIFVWAIRNA